MNEVMTIIQDTLTANNGVMTWNAMLEAVPFQLRRHIWNALNALKDQNIAEARNRYDPEIGGVFEIVQLGG